MTVDMKLAKKSLPFCSERCRLVDLGRWLNEEHALPFEEDDEESDAAKESAAESGSRSSIRLPPGWHDA